MPEQGARAALGDQGGGGAVLTPLRRLTIAGVGVIGGGAVVAVGTRLAWVSVLTAGAIVDNPDLPPVSLGGGEFPLSGPEVGAGYLFGLGLLLALVPLGWLVAGPRGRIALGLIGVVLSVGIGYGVATARSGSTEHAREFGMQLLGGREDGFFGVSSGPGPGVTAAGAALAGLASLAGALSGRYVPKLRMPEQPDRDDR